MSKALLALAGETIGFPLSHVTAAFICDFRLAYDRVAEANLLFSTLTTESNNSRLAVKRCVCDMIYPSGLDKL